MMQLKGPKTVTTEYQKALLISLGGSIVGLTPELVVQHAI